MNLSASISFSAILHASWLAAVVLVPLALGLESRAPAQEFERPMVRMEMVEAPALAELVLPWEVEPAADSPAPEEPLPEEAVAEAPAPEPEERVERRERQAEPAREAAPQRELPIERAVATHEESELPAAAEAAPAPDTEERAEAETDPAEALAEGGSDTQEPPVEQPEATDTALVADARPRAAESPSRASVSEERPALPDLDALLDGYTARLNTIVRRNYEYPRIARRAGLQGTVVVEVVIDEQGRVLDVRVRQSSGHGVLDRAALASITAIGSFPAPPSEMDWDRRPIQIPMVYSL